MKKMFVSIILLFVFFTFSFGQVDASRENILAGGFNKGVSDIPEVWDNMKQKFSHLNPKEDFLAIVLCSADPLPVALNLAYFDVMKSIYEITPHIVVGQDEKTGELIFAGSDFITVPRDRILLLRRTTNCDSGKNVRANSIYWVVKPNNELPSFVEIRNAVDLERYDIVSAGKYLTQQMERGIERNSFNYDKYLINLTPEVYKTALGKTTSFMKEHRTAIATVKIYYSGKRPSRIVDSRALEAKKSLENNGINSSRVYIRRISIDPNAKSNAGDYKYPEISVVYEYPTAATGKKDEKNFLLLTLPRKQTVNGK